MVVPINVVYVEFPSVFRSVETYDDAHKYLSRFMETSDLNDDDILGPSKSRKRCQRFVAISNNFLCANPQ